MLEVGESEDLVVETFEEGEGVGGSVANAFTAVHEETDAKGFEPGKPGLRHRLHLLRKRMSSLLG